MEFMELYTYICVWTQVRSLARACVCVCVRSEVRVEWTEAKQLLFVA